MKWGEEEMRAGERLTETRNTWEGRLELKVIMFTLSSCTALSGELEWQEVGPALHARDGSRVQPGFKSEVHCI